ncbi:hypothetical protein [Anabaena sp. CCY 9402-a]|uniref:hypothetical protein n=1 Tax=Anabaena sp. CCY 9402-a TaxID=3103867 RepID=UPI0039C64363
MKTKLQIISAVMLCLSAFLVIPKVADATATFRHSPNLASHHPDSNPTKTRQYQQKDVFNTYVPPNYGGPDSEYGSGTR